MSLTVTAWRLTDQIGRLAQCVISERDGRWLLFVRQGGEITFSERCPTDDEALSRAMEIWRVMVEQGWTEPKH